MLNTGKRRQAIIAAFNHHMDGNARQINPHLTEEERYDLAITELRSQGIELNENDLVSSLSDAQRAHLKRMEKPARDGHTISSEAASRANNVVNGILDIFVSRNERKR